MRSSLIFAASGLVLGAGLIVLLPQRALFAVAKQHDHAAEMASGERWACPMMDFIGNRPGDCPVCGMKMTKVAAGELTREQQRRMDLQTARVSEGPAAVTVHASGTANYDHRFTHVVIPRVAGRIVKRYMSTFSCCSDLEQGEPLIDLYSEEVINAQGELAAALKLGNAALVSAIKERFARWNLVDVAEGIVKGDAVRDVVTIHSPVAGQVLLKDMDAVNEALEVGKQVAPDTPLVRLVDPDKLVLVLHVPESRARFLAEGQPVTFATDDGGPIAGLEARIDRLAYEIDPEIRSREVRVYLEKVRGIVNPGALITARLHGALDPEMKPAASQDEKSWGRFPLVPKTAVLSTGVRNVVWRVAERQKDGRLRFELVPVALGPRIEDESGNDLYVIRAGLKPGDEVAIQGAFLIDSQAQLAGTPSLLFPMGAVPSGGHAH